MNTRVASTFKAYAVKNVSDGTYFRKLVNGFPVPTLFQKKGHAAARIEELKKVGWDGASRMNREVRNDPTVAPPLGLAELTVTVGELYNLDKKPVVAASPMVAWTVINTEDGTFLKNKKFGNFPQAYMKMGQAISRAKQLQHLPVTLAVAKLHIRENSVRVGSQRSLTASDRKSLIRLAASLPAGDKGRRVILAGLNKVSAH